MVLINKMDNLTSRPMIVLLLLFAVQSVTPYILPRYNYDDSEGLESALQLLERNRLNNVEDNSQLQENFAAKEENKLQQIIREILEEEQENPDGTYKGINDDFNENSDENISEDDGTELLNRLGMLQKRGGPRFGHRKPSILSRLMESEDSDMATKFSHRKPGRLDKRYFGNDEDDDLEFEKRFAHRKPYRQSYYRRKYQPRKRDTFDLLRSDEELDFEKKYSHRKPYRYNSRPKPRLYKRDIQDLTPEEDLSDIEEEKKWSHRKPFRKLNLLRSSKRDLEDYDLDETDNFDKRYSHRKPGRKHSYRFAKREYDDFDDDMFEEDKRFSHRKPTKYRSFTKSPSRPKKFYDDSSDESEGNENPIAAESYRDWMIKNYFQSMAPQPIGNENSGDKPTDAGESNNDANNDNNNNSNNKQAKNEGNDSNKESVSSNDEKKTEVGTMENKVRTVEDAVLRDAIGMIEDAKVHGYSTENDPNAQREFARMVAAYKLDKLRQSMTSGNETKKIKRDVIEAIENDDKAHNI